MLITSYESAPGWLWLSMSITNYVCNAKYPILKDVSWCAVEGGYS